MVFDVSGFVESIGTITAAKSFNTVNTGYVLNSTKIGKIEDREISNDARYRWST